MQYAAIDRRRPRKTGAIRIWPGLGGCSPRHRRWRRDRATDRRGCNAAAPKPRHLLRFPHRSATSLRSQLSRGTLSDSAPKLRALSGSPTQKLGHPLRSRTQSCDTLPVPAAVGGGGTPRLRTPKLRHPLPTPAPEAAAPSPVPAARAAKHMVVAANPLAAQAGLEILRAGGSAIDAAIAVQMVLNVVEPQSSGIGGGGFLVHYSAKSESIETACRRETARRRQPPDMFLNSDGSRRKFGRRGFRRPVSRRPGPAPDCSKRRTKINEQAFRAAAVRFGIELATRDLRYRPSACLVSRDRHLKKFDTTRSYFF